MLLDAVPSIAALKRAQAAAKRCEAEALELEANAYDARGDGDHAPELPLVEVALAGVEQKALRRLIACGRMPAARIGRKLYVRTDDLAKLPELLPARIGSPIHDTASGEVDDAYEQRVVSLRTRGAR